MSEAEEVYTVEELEQVLNQAETIKGAQIVHVFQYGGESVASVGSPVVPSADFAQIRDNTIGVQAITFNSEPYVFIGAEEKEKDSSENKIWRYMSKNKLSINEHKDVKVSLCVLYHEWGVFVAVQALEMDMRMVLGELISKMVESAD